MSTPLRSLPYSYTPLTGTPFSLTPTATHTGTPAITRVASRASLYVSETDRAPEEVNEIDLISDVFTDVRIALDTQDIDTFIQNNLGLESLNPVSFRQEQVVKDLEISVGPEAFAQIHKICREASSLEEVSKRLVGYVEYTLRKDNLKLAELIAEWIVEGSFLSILENPDIDHKEAFIKKLDELDICRQEAALFTPQKIEASWIRSLLTPVLANISSTWVGVEVTAIQEGLQTFLEERIFNPSKDCILDKQFFGIWMRINDDKSLCVICYPKKEASAAEIFIPPGATEIFAPKMVEVVQMDKETLLKKLENHKLVVGLPSSELCISPDPTVHLDSPYLLKKEPGFISLQGMLEKDPLTLSPIDRLKICFGVLEAVEVLESGNLVCPAIDSASIMIKKREEIKIGGQVTIQNRGRIKLDNLLHLRSLLSEDRDYKHKSLDENRLDLLAREKDYISLDTGRYGLILFICELFFLKVKGPLTNIDTTDWENQALERFKLRASPGLYADIMKMRRKRIRFGNDFLQDIVGVYQRRKARKEKEEKIPLEDEALKQLVSNLAMFPYLSKLLIDTLQVEDERGDRVEEGRLPDQIPSMEPMFTLADIRKTLTDAETELKVALGLLKQPPQKKR